MILIGRAGLWLFNGLLDLAWEIIQLIGNLFLLGIATSILALVVSVTLVITWVIIGGIVFCTSYVVLTFQGSFTPSEVVFYSQILGAVIGFLGGASWGSYIAALSTRA